MRVFRFWQTVPLKVAFHATFDIVPFREIDDEGTALFDAIVAAVKASGCEWEMREKTDNVVEKSKHADEPWPGRGKKE